MKRKRSSTSQTLYRHLLMLSMLSRKWWTSSNYLKAKLAASGHRVTNRQVQYDLAQYSRPDSPIRLEVQRVRGGPYQYRWAKGFKIVIVDD